MYPYVGERVYEVASRCDETLTESVAFLIFCLVCRVRWIVYVREFRTSAR